MSGEADMSTLMRDPAVANAAQTLAQNPELAQQMAGLNNSSSSNQ